MAVQAGTQETEQVERQLKEMVVMVALLDMVVSEAKQEEQVVLLVEVAAVPEVTDKMVVMIANLLDKVLVQRAVQELQTLLIQVQQKQLLCYIQHK